MILKLIYYNIFIEEHVIEKFEIEAEDMEKAIKIAEKKYFNGEFVLEPGNVSHRLMAGEIFSGEECSEWFEF